VRGIDRETTLEYRMGFSTHRYVSQAGTADTPTTASPPQTDRPSQYSVATTSSGQCHR